MRRVLLAGVVALALAACGDSNGGGDKSDLQTIEGVVVEAADSRDHVEGSVDYPQSPPSGGAHNAVWQNCGFYEASIFDETAVHALEHGVVWLAYSPDLSDDDLSTVRELFELSDGRAIASPHPDVDVLEVVAWRHRLVVDDVNDERVATFVDLARPGEHAPEPGASCEGGISEVRDPAPS